MNSVAAAAGGQVAMIDTSSSSRPPTKYIDLSPLEKVEPCGRSNIAEKKCSGDQREISSITWQMFLTEVDQMFLRDSVCMISLLTSSMQVIHKDLSFC